VFQEASPVEILPPNTQGAASGRTATSIIGAQREDCYYEKTQRSLSAMDG
jgi:hypothetical protein